MRYINNEWEELAKELEEARKVSRSKEIKEITIMEFIEVDEV